MIINCLCCNSHVDLFKNINGYDYYICSECNTIFIDPSILDKMDNDADFSLVNYDEDYWQVSYLVQKKDLMVLHWLEWRKLYTILEYL